MRLLNHISFYFLDIQFLIFSENVFAIWFFSIETYIYFNA